MLIKFRLDHSPDDNPDDCVNRVLDWFCRFSTLNQINDFSVEYASRYCTYLTIDARDTPSPVHYLTETFHTNEYYFTLSTLV